MNNNYNFTKEDNIKSAEIRKDTAITDILDQDFNYLHVDDFDHFEERKLYNGKTQNKYYFLTTCKLCGKKSIFEKADIVNGYKISCGCLKVKNDTKTIHEITFLNNNRMLINDKEVRIFRDPRDILERNIGHLYVERLIGARVRSKDTYEYIYNCICDCGKEVEKSSRFLLSNLDNDSCSCGCTKYDYLESDILYNEYDNLIVVAFDHKERNMEPSKIINNKGNKDYYYWCRCKNCGDYCLAKRDDLFNGHKKSCGCMYNSHADEVGYESFKSIYNGMIERCYNKRVKAYPYYGGRGIRVCDEWKLYKNFKRDMFESYKEHVDKYGKNDTSIDRKNVNGNYCKNNCRWATRIEQANNTRTNRFTEYRGIQYTARQAMILFADSSLTYEEFRNRLRYPNRGYVDEFGKIININIFRDDKYRASLNLKTPVKELSFLESSKYFKLIQNLPKTFNMHENKLNNKEE